MSMTLIDAAGWLKAARHRHGSEFRYERQGRPNSVEPVLQEGKRTDLQVRQLLQERQRRNRLNMATELRVLLEQASLHNVSGLRTYPIGGLADIDRAVSRDVSVEVKVLLQLIRELITLC